jgi:hypothetical protein
MRTISDSTSSLLRDPWSVEDSKDTEVSTPPEVPEFADKTEQAQKAADAKQAEETRKAAEQQAHTRALRHLGHKATFFDVVAKVAEPLALAAAAGSIIAGGASAFAVDPIPLDHCSSSHEDYHDNYSGYDQFRLDCLAVSAEMISRPVTAEVLPDARTAYTSEESINLGRLEIGPHAGRYALSDGTNIYVSDNALSDPTEYIVVPPTQQVTNFIQDKTEQLDQADNAQDGQERAQIFKGVGGAIAVGVVLGGAGIGAEKLKVKAEKDLKAEQQKG